jgi:hypothetical protein
MVVAGDGCSASNYHSTEAVSLRKEEKFYGFAVVRFEKLDATTQQGRPQTWIYGLRGSCSAVNFYA